MHQWQNFYTRIIRIRTVNEIASYLGNTDNLELCSSGNSHIKKELQICIKSNRLVKELGTPMYCEEKLNLFCLCRGFFRRKEIHSHIVLRKYIETFCILILKFGIVQCS